MHALYTVKWLIVLKHVRGKSYPMMIVMVFLMPNDQGCEIKMESYYLWIERRQM